jgi:hypothetical protein
MYSGAGVFSDGIESRDGGATVEVCGNAAHPVVGSRGYRNRLVKGIAAPGAAYVDDVRKAIQETILRDGPHIEPDLGIADALQVVKNGPTDHISGG